VKKLSTYLFLIIFSFSTISYAGTSVTDYSLLIEEDGDAVMFVYRYSDKEDVGEIIQYGGYKWFNDTYSNPPDETITFVQPGHFGVDGDMNSWMIERFQVDSFNYNLRYEKNDQILSFNTPRVIQNISGYITRKESFSLSTLSNTTWYAGTFLAVKSIDDLKLSAKQNSRTFCKILSDPIVINKKNRELKTSDLVRLMSKNGLKCDNNFSLI
jgi:hypothetical protein